MADRLTHPVRLSIASTPAHLPVVRAALERLAGLMGFDEGACGQLVLAVDEALTNVIRHAYHGRPDQPIEVGFVPVWDAPDQAALRVEIRDWGDQGDPAKIRPRKLEDVRPGGLGVHLMNRCMDKVEYASTPDGGTHLTMVKLCKSRSSQ